MYASDYQQAAMKFRANTRSGMRSNLVNGALGLAGEAGEVSDSLKKNLFHGHAFNKESLVEELGDVLWYVALLAQAIETDLATVMALNIQKLTKRYPNGFDPEASKARYAVEAK